MVCLYALGCSSWQHAAPQASAHLRLSGVWRSCLVSTVSPVPTGHKGSVFAIGLMRHSDEHAMEACQIGSRPGYQGCQACDKVQWFEDDVGSTGPKAFAALMGPAFAVRCLQLIVNIAARCQRQAPFRYRRPAADANVPKRLSTLHPCRAMYRHRRSSFLRSSALADTPACREKPDTLAAVSTNSSGSLPGRVCRVYTLRPACGPTAMR